MVHKAPTPRARMGGTDTGALAYPPPGFILLREVEMLADSLGAMQAIQAVTSAAARHLRRGNDIGAVAAGQGRAVHEGLGRRIWPRPIHHHLTSPPPGHQSLGPRHSAPLNAT